MSGRIFLIFLVVLLTKWLNYTVKMNQTKEKSTEEIILKAAKEVFQTKGMDGARMQEIADKANINKAMLHYYYRSKQSLFEAVFNRAFSLLAPQLHAVLNDDSTVEEKIKNFTYNYIDFISKYPFIPSFVFHELNRNPNFIEKLKNNVSFPSIDKFKKQVEEEIAKGTIKKISTEQLFINIISLNAFPFIGAPLIKAITNLDKESYKELIEERKVHVSEFIIHAIKK